MPLYVPLIGSGITPGSTNYTTAGTFTFTVPRYSIMYIDIWGGGGSGGNAYNGGRAAGGGFGGNYVRYTVLSGLTFGSTETVVVGTGGSKVYGNTPGLGGGYSQFGNSITADGGRGGSSQFTSGGNGGIYSPTNIRSSIFLLSIAESGGGGGYGNGGPGGDVTYAGGGGGGMTNDYGGARGGYSTYGGWGGKGGDGGNAFPGNAPGGGGGASDWDGGAGSGAGGAGRIYITWF